ncbi:hypothetical protein [Virgibacillus pantothenticus]|uniref:hypothetical protein n=1 Tax=Virgibacillus pantothenticus TaxID=1473 RepID=UPI001BB02531|nr:hypothetical protein [Virgibacillus pantothenticus]
MPLRRRHTPVFSGMIPLSQLIRSICYVAKRARRAFVRIPFEVYDCFQDGKGFIEEYSES